MKASGHTGAPALAAVLLWSGVAAALAAEPSQDTRSSNERLPASSRCMAECDKQEVRCEELEKQFPTCGTADICLEEKEQCQAKCRVTATGVPPVPERVTAKVGLLLSTTHD